MASLKKWLDRRRNPWKGVAYDAFRAWRREDGRTRLFDYGWLPDGAIVFDFGGFRGEWTEMVLENADCTCHVFEPHPRFAADIKDRFAGKPNVIVHGFALGSQNGTLELSDEGDASSSVAAHGKSFEAPIHAAAEFFAQNNIPDIALAKINIEGGEYDLLPALIETGAIRKIDRIQVQFHLFAPEFVEMRDRIRKSLAKTHDCAWSYPFVWEEWHRR